MVTAFRSKVSGHKNIYLAFVTIKQYLMLLTLLQLAEARGVAAAIVQESSNLRLTDLAKLLRRDNSALAKAAQRLEVTHIVREIVTGIEANKGKTKPLRLLQKS